MARPYNRWGRDDGDELLLAGQDNRPASTDETNQAILRAAQYHDLG